MFDALHYPHDGGEVRAIRRSAVKLQSHIFSSLPLSSLFLLLKKHVAYCKKKKKIKKSGFLFDESN